MKKTHRSPIYAALLGTLSLSAGHAEVTVDSSIVGNRRDGFGAQTHIIATGLDASASDKLVVAVATEHDFGGTSKPSEPIVTLGGQTLNLAISATSDTSGRVSILYLDNPGSGDLIYSEPGGSNGSSWNVLLLSGTLEGIGEVSSDPVDSTSLVTTGGGSYLLSALMTDAPTVSGTPIPAPTAEAPQTEIAVEAWNPGREYGVLGTASQIGEAAGSTATATWTNPNTPDWGSVIALAEFLSADGGGEDLQITGISYDSEANAVVLTWPKTGAASFAVKQSPDLQDWSLDSGLTVTEASDEDTEDPDQITVTVPVVGDLLGAGQVFFRVEEGS